jgi:anti-sigma factor RsiW
MNHISDANLQALLDGELSAAEHRQVSEHADLCPTCGARLAAFRELYALVESLPEESLQIDMASAVTDRLRSQPAISGRVRWVLLVELGLGVASLGAALGWLKASLPSWSSQLFGGLQSTFQPVDLQAWMASLTTPIRTGLAAVTSFSEGATAPLASALPVTGWAVLLAALLLAGLVANGWFLMRSSQPRPRDRRST